MPGYYWVGTGDWSSFDTTLAEKNRGATLLLLMWSPLFVRAASLPPGSGLNLHQASSDTTPVGKEKGAKSPDSASGLN